MKNNIQKLTTTSHIVAEYIGKPHDDVCRDICRLLESRQYSRDSIRPVVDLDDEFYSIHYELDFRVAMLMMCQFDFVKLDIIDRWLELELMAEPLLADGPLSLAIMSLVNGITGNSNLPNIILNLFNKDVVGPELEGPE